MPTDIPSRPSEKNPADNKHETDNIDTHQLLILFAFILPPIAVLLILLLLAKPGAPPNAWMCMEPDCLTPYQAVPQGVRVLLNIAAMLPGFAAS